MSSVEEKLRGSLPPSPSPLHSVNSSLTVSGEVEMDKDQHGVGCVGKLVSAWRVATRGSVVSSIFILLTTCIGAGTLSLPYGFAQGGVVFSSVVFFVIMIISIHVGTMLFAGKRYAAEVYPDREVWGYADLAEVAYGTIGKIAVLLTIAVLLFLALIAYMIYARDQLDAIVSFALSAAGHTPPACSPLVNCAVLMCIAFIPVFPVTLLRNLSPLQFTSYLSIICVTFVAIAVSIKAGLEYTQANATALAEHTIQLGPRDFNGSLTVISYCSLAFVCHFNLLPLQKELKGPVTKVKLYTIILGSILIAYTIYNVVIFSTYFTFFGTVKEDVMVNYAKDDHLITAARVALFFMLVTSYPVLLHPTRESINSVIFLAHDMVVNDMRKRRRKSRPNVNSEDEKLLNDDIEPVNSGKAKVPTLIWFCETWILFAASFLAASFIPNVGYVWNFVGSIGGVLVLYIYPAACYLRLRYVRYKLRSDQKEISIMSQYDGWEVLKEIVAWIILVLGFLLLIVENYQAISAVVNSTHEPTGLCYQLKCEIIPGNFSHTLLDWV